MKIYTTLKRIKKLDPCSDELEVLYEVIGKDFPEDKEIYFADLIKANVDIDYVMWGLQATPKKQKKQVECLLAAFACDCAERVLPFFEKQYPDDKRPRNAIEITRQWLRGEVTAAAWAAAWAAARDAARDAARAASRAAAWDASMAARAAAWDATRAAAWDAAWDATRAAAWDAAWDAAWAAEKKWQLKRFAQYLNGEVEA